MIKWASQYFASIPPAFIDGLLYITIAFFGAWAAAFSSDEAAKYITPEPLLLAALLLRIHQRRVARAQNVSLYQLRRSHRNKGTKTMKSEHLLIALLFAALAAFGLTGCGTTRQNLTPEQQSAIEANNWSSFVERVAFNATKGAIIAEPKYRAPITAGNAALTLFLSSTNLDYAEFTRILNELDVKAPSSEWASLIEGNLDMEFQRWIKEQQILAIAPDVWLRPIAEAANKGITRGLK